MSRTRKDEPYFVKKKKKGIVHHDLACVNYSPTVERTEEFTEIFFANEVKEMEALEAKIAEDGDSFVKKDISGYLVTKIRESGFGRRRPFTYSQKRVTFPHREFVDKEYHHPNYYAAPAPSYLGVALYTAAEHTVSEFDVFYVYTITRNVKHTQNGWGPRGQQEAQQCCTPNLAAPYNGCSCCKWDDPDRSESRSKTRDKMKASAKTFNSEGLEAFEDILLSDDEDDLSSSLVYTSETPVSV